MLQKKLEIIYDSIGQPYLVCKFYPYEIMDTLDLFKEKVPNWEVLQTLRNTRDGHNYHVTVLTSQEFKKYKEDKNIEEILKQDFVLENKGIGCVKKDGLEDYLAYFAVISSDALTQFRKTAGFGEKDFHITLGFTPKDVFYHSNKTIAQKNEVLFPLNNKIKHSI